MSILQIPFGRRGNMQKPSDPAPFRTPDGRITGWKVRFPGGRPLATPAVVGGRVFLGAGFGSYGNRSHPGGFALTRSDLAGHPRA